MISYCKPRYHYSTWRRIDLHVRRSASAYLVGCCVSEYRLLLNSTTSIPKISRQDTRLKSSNVLKESIQVLGLVYGHNRSVVEYMIGHQYLPLDANYLDATMPSRPSVILLLSVLLLLLIILVFSITSIVNKYYF